MKSSTFELSLICKSILQTWKPPGLAALTPINMPLSKKLFSIYILGLHILSQIKVVLVGLNEESSEQKRLKFLWPNEVGNS